MASATTTPPATSNLNNNPNRRQQYQATNQARRSKQNNYPFSTNESFFFNQNMVFKFELNTLVWAKLNNYPWWPCKIVNDQNNEFTKIVDNTQMYYIEFFGPQLERAWLSYANIFRYKGIESFKIYAQDQVDRALSKSAKEKLAERYQLKVALNRRDQWEQAIEQADLYLRSCEIVNQIDENSGYSSTRQEKSKSASLADSLARLNQINEEKIHGKKSSLGGQTVSVKKKLMRKNLYQDEFITSNLQISNSLQQHQQLQQKQQGQVRYAQKHSQNSQQFLEENISNKMKQKAKKFVNINTPNKAQIHTNHTNLNDIKQQKIKCEELEYQQQTQFHSIESLRHEKSLFAFSDAFNSSESSKGRLIQSFNRPVMSKKRLNDEEIFNNADSDTNLNLSQNSGSSSDEDNDSLFQPTSIFEYDIEQPTQLVNKNFNRGENHNEDNDNYDHSLDQNNNFNSRSHTVDDNRPHSINSIVAEIKSNIVKHEDQYPHENFYHHNHSQDLTEHEYTAIQSFMTSDSDQEDDKLDKNDTEWSNTSFKSNKRRYHSSKSSSSTTNKKLTKYNASQSDQYNSNFQSQHQTYEKSSGDILVKKKRGRKPKFTLHDTRTQFTNDENKTSLLSSSTMSTEEQQQICQMSSNNSSRRASNISDDEIYKKRVAQDVLVEDTGVVNKVGRKSGIVKVKVKTVKRSVKNGGEDDFSTMEKINQMADLDYNQFVDESLNSGVIVGSGSEVVSEQVNSSNVGGNSGGGSVGGSVGGGVGGGVGGHSGSAETYLIDRYKYAVRHIRQGLSVEEACNKYRISKGALLKCLSGGTAPRGKKTRLTELEENEIVEWLINNKDLKYNEAIHLVFEQVEKIFKLAQRPNPFNNGKPSMDWWYDFLSRHPQIMASKPDWLMRGKVNDQYIKDVQSGQLKCTKFRRALLSAIQYIRSLNDAQTTNLSSSSSTGSVSGYSRFSTSTKVLPGLSNRIEKSEISSSSTPIKAVRQKNSKTTNYYKSSLLKRKSSLSIANFEHNSNHNDLTVEELADDDTHIHTVPSPTSLDTRIFNTDSCTNNSSPTHSHCHTNSQNFSLMTSRKTDPLRPIKTEKSIQDSLEYLYEQNNNFINEISNINQLMDHNNNNNSYNNYNNNNISNSACGGSKCNNVASPDNLKDQDEKQKMPTIIDNSFDNFLDQALSSTGTNHQDTANFEDLISSKLVESSVLTIGVTNSNLSVPSSNSSSTFNPTTGSACSSIADFVAESNFVNQSLLSTGDETNYFQSNFNYKQSEEALQQQQQHKKQQQNQQTQQQTQQQSQQNSAFFLNQLPQTSFNTSTFTGYTQSQPFSSKLDFSAQKNHLLVQDDDENDDDIELVNSILSNTTEENLTKDTESSLLKVKSINPAGFLP